MSGVFVAHLPSQIEQVAALVDLLETSLTLPEGAIVCTSLPGYALSSASANAEDFKRVIETASIVIGIVDNASLVDPQLLFELGGAWSLGKWLVLITDREGYEAALPWQLRGAAVVSRSDKAGLVSMVEDLAFQLDSRPRISRDAHEAIAMLSMPPPAAAPRPDPAAHTAQTVRPPGKAQAAPVAAEASSDYESYESVRPPAPGQMLPPAAYDDLDLNDSDLLRLEPLEEHLSCALSLEAGRAISECAFHREPGRNLASELETSFGRFVEAVGGDWQALRKLNDVDVWMGATDNLLETLPAESKHISDWYELGFQLTTLLNIAGEGLPVEPDQRAVYEEAWTQAIEQFQSSALEARIQYDDVSRMQQLLHNLIGPEEQRDYTNISRSIDALRQYAAYADYN